MPVDPFVALGEFLTGSEAEALAVQFAVGQHTAKALAVVNVARREEAKELLAAAGLGHADGGTLAMKTYGHLLKDHSRAAAKKVDFTSQGVDAQTSVA